MADGPLTYEQYSKLYPSNHLLVLGPGNPVRKIAFHIGTSKVYEDLFFLLTL